MLFIMAACAVLILIWTGVGLLFSRKNEPGLVQFGSLLNRFWIGWALAIAFLQIWNFFFPIGGPAFVIIACASFFGWFRARGAVLSQIKTWGWARILLAGGLAGIPLVMLSSHVMYDSPHYDHGLYHLQTVRWLNQYAIVPGLGNLHHRLAFNNANLLYTAVINWGPFNDRAYYLATTMLGFMVILAGANGFFQLFQPASRRRVSSLYFAWMLPVALWQFSNVFFSGYSPDVVIFALQVVTGGAFLQLTESEDKTQAEGRMALVTLLVCVGMTVKLSFIVFGTGTLLAALIFRWIRFSWNRKNDVRTIAALAGLAAVFLIPWVVRNGILSGYPFFPSMALALPLTWRIPETLTEPIAPIITEWARTVSNTIPYTGDLAWFRQWWAYFPHIPVQRALMLSGMLLLVNLGMTFAMYKKIKPSIASALLFAISALSGMYWFWMAPDYRFSGAALWLILITNSLFLAHLLIESGKVQTTLLASAVLLALTLWLNPNQFLLQRPGTGQILYPLPETLLLEKRFEPGPFSAQITDSGLAVQIPVETSDQCWYADLPCTRRQDFLLKLRLIDPENMQKGFIIQK